MVPSTVPPSTKKCALPKASAALEQADRAFTAGGAASLEPLSEAERQALAQLLARLTAAESPDTRAPTQEAADGPPSGA